MCMFSLILSLSVCLFTNKFREREKQFNLAAKRLIVLGKITPEVTKLNHLCSSVQGKTQ